MMMDPIISPILLGGLGSAGVTAAIGLTAAGILAHVLSFVIVAGVAVGLYLLTAPSLPKPEDGKVAVQETVPPRGFAYGRVRLSGSVMLKETGGQQGGRLGVVLALVSHEVKAFVKIFLNDDQAKFGGADFPATPNPDGFVVDVQSDGRYGDNRVWICVRNGVVPETYMAMLHNYEIMAWPVTARGDGIASLAMVCTDANADGNDSQQKRFPYGAPTPTAVCDTAFVFATRLSSSCIFSASRSSASATPTIK
jgi:hypothetical protein